MTFVRSALAVLAVIFAPQALGAGLSTSAQIQVCKATISQVMGRPISIMKGTFDGEYVTLTYKRPDDGKKWTFGCQVMQMNSEVLWRALLEDGRWGRWRDTKEDGVISYQINGRRLGIRESAEGPEFKWFPFKP